MPLVGKIGLSASNIVLDSYPAAPSQKWDRAPNFWPMSRPQFLINVYCGQTAAWIKMPLGMEVGLGPGHIVLDDTQLPLRKKGAHPQFSAHVCCDQTAG